MPQDAEQTNVTSTQAQEPATEAATDTTKAITIKSNTIEDLQCTAPDCPFVADRPSGLATHKLSQYVSSNHFRDE